jgi:hypothetical protein
MLKKMEEFHFAGKCELQNKGCLKYNENLRCCH